MNKTAIINLGKIVSGNWMKPFKKGDGILMNRGLIQNLEVLLDSLIALSACPQDQTPTNGLNCSEMKINIWKKINSSD